MCIYMYIIEVHTHRYTYCTYISTLLFKYCLRPSMNAILLS